MLKGVRIAISTNRCKLQNMEKDMGKKPKEKRKPLGRGLNSLLGPISQSLKEPVIGPETAVPDSKSVTEKDLRERISRLSIVEIKPNPYQPRTTWNDEELTELTESIKANGVIQPILVRKTGTHFEVIAGERRLRASQQAGLSEIPAIVRKASDEDMLELALVENIHRSDLNAIERAIAYQRFISSFSLTQAQAAQRLGENRSVVANYLRLLDLPRDIKQMLIDHQLTMGHARAILALPTDDLRRKLANRAMAGRLSVREVERLVRKHLEGNSEAKVKEKQKSPHIVDLEGRLRDSLGTKVQIDVRKKGERGRIVIDFYSLDEFDRLTGRLGLSDSGTI